MAEVIFSSSYDEKNPPENIFEQSKKKFFSSTGMYPQEICIQFEPVKKVNSVNVTSYGIKKIAIHTCENDSAHFVKQSDQSNISNSNGLQNIKLELKTSPNVRVLKIEILEGHEDFFTIHNVGIL